MTEVSATQSVAPAVSGSLRLPGWLSWFLISAISAPIAIVLHELGHFIAAHTFGFPNVVLHFGSVSDGATEIGAPEWQQALTAGAGPLVTLVIVALCCHLSWRHGAHPWTVAPAFAAGIRSVLVGVGYGIIRIRHVAATGNMDELNFARGLGLSSDAVMAISTLFVVACWAFLIMRIPPTARVRVLLMIAMGAGAGLILYIPWLGPRLLP